MVINVGIRFGHEAEIAGQKHLMPTGLLIAISDTAQRNGTVYCFGASQHDGLIADQPFGLEDVVTLDNAILGVSLLPDDEGNILAIQCIEPFAVGIGAINDNKAIG